MSPLTSRQALLAHELVYSWQVSPTLCHSLQGTPTCAWHECVACSRTQLIPRSMNFSSCRLHARLQVLTPLVLAPQWCWTHGRSHLELFTCMDSVSCHSHGVTASRACIIIQCTASQWLQFFAILSPAHRWLSESIHQRAMARLICRRLAHPACTCSSVPACLRFLSARFWQQFHSPAATQLIARSMISQLL